VRCAKCGVKLVAVPWARADSGFTLLFEALVMMTIEYARMLRRHENGVLRWAQSRISNGVLEGTNSMLQAAKARARGYRSVRNLIAMAYLIAGKLDSGCYPRETARNQKKKLEA